MCVVFYSISCYATFKCTKTKHVNMRETISIRPTEEIERKLEKLMDLEKTEKSNLIRKILIAGIDKELKTHALTLYRDKKVSFAKAAEIAEISIREMMDLEREEGFSLHITIEDIKEDFEAAMKRYGCSILFQ